MLQVWKLVNPLASQQASRWSQTWKLQGWTWIYSTGAWFWVLSSVMTSRKLFLCLPSPLRARQDENLRKYLRSRWCFPVHRKCVRIHNITIYDFLSELYAMCAARNSLRIVFQFISPKIKVFSISCNSRVLVRNFYTAKLSGRSVKYDRRQNSFEGYRASATLRSPWPGNMLSPQQQLCLWKVCLFEGEDHKWFSSFLYLTQMAHADE